MKIVLTGGLGFIGSHAAVMLANTNHEIIILDNLSNSNILTLDKINKLTKKKVKFFQCDLVDYINLNCIRNINGVDAIVHFAGLKSVSESQKKPYDYYKNNFISSMNIVRFMNEKKINKLIFSSSATVYGDTNVSPIKEIDKIKPINTYGETKVVIENFVKNICNSNSDFSCVSLRYFNPVGAHDSGLIGEVTKGKPNNLMPLMLNVASGEQNFLNIYGNDYPTKDGTGVRDYVLVLDVAEGHISAIQFLEKNSGFFEFNLGTGRGVSVLELINELETSCEIKIPYKFTSRRKGDVALCYADPSKANKILNWTAKRDLKNMCTTAWLHKLSQNNN